MAFLEFLGGVCAKAAFDSSSCPRGFVFFPAEVPSNDLLYLFMRRENSLVKDFVSTGTRSKCRCIMLPKACRGRDVLHIL